MARTAGGRVYYEVPAPVMKHGVASAFVFSDECFVMETNSGTAFQAGDVCEVVIWNDGRVSVKKKSARRSAASRRAWQTRKAMKAARSALP